MTHWRKKEPVEAWFSVYYSLNSKAKFTVEADACFFAALITIETDMPARIYSGTRLFCVYADGKREQK